MARKKISIRRQIEDITFKFANYFGYGINKELSDKLLKEMNNELIDAFNSLEAKKQE